MTLFKKKIRAKDSVFTSMIKTKCHGVVERGWVERERDIGVEKTTKTLNAHLFTIVLFGG